MQKLYQSFDLGVVKSLIWQTSSTAYSCSQLSTRGIKACSNTVLHVSLDGSNLHLTLLLNCDQMRNDRLRLNFSNHLYKNASQSNFETSEVLIRTTSSPWDQGRTLVFLPVCLVYIWVSDWSAKLVENTFDTKRCPKR